MGRLIGSVLLGYVVMAVLIFVSFSVLYVLMGADRSFQAGTYDPSALWISVSVVLGILASVAGGWVCAVVARSDKGPKALAVLVIVLGLALAVPVLRAPAESPPRTGEVSNMEAMQRARQPAWIALLNPFLGALGVLAGARRRPQAAA
jgi:hypothetical protein